MNELRAPASNKRPGIWGSWLSGELDLRCPQGEEFLMPQ